MLRGCCQSSLGSVCMIRQLGPPSSSSPAVSACRSSPQFPEVRDQKCYGRCMLKKQQRFFFRIILGVSSYLKAEREACARTAPRTVTLLQWIYNCHLNHCQEGTELLVSHFSTSENKLGCTSDMYHFYFLFFIFLSLLLLYNKHSEALSPSCSTHREGLYPSFFFFRDFLHLYSLFCTGKAKICYLEEQWLLVFSLCTSPHPNSTPG